MDLPQRKTIRIKQYDYGLNGAYFITFCCKDKHCLLWEQINDVNLGRPIDLQVHQLSSIGIVVDEAIKHVSKHCPSVEIDKYVIMPNHVHMIITIKNTMDNALQSPTISTILSQMKGIVTKQIGFSIWQKLFYDHVIRDDEEYQRIWNYIDLNPYQWESDRFNCSMIQY